MGPAGRLPWLRRKGRWQQELRPREAAGNHAANRASPRLHVGFLPGAPPPSSAAPRWVGQGAGGRARKRDTPPAPCPHPWLLRLVGPRCRPFPHKGLVAPASPVCPLCVPRVSTSPQHLSSGQAAVTFCQGAGFGHWSTFQLCESKLLNLSRAQPHP